MELRLSTYPKVKLLQIGLMSLGIGILVLGVSDELNAIQAASNLGNFNEERFREATNRIFLYLEGSFGALIMVCAGLGAVVSAAFGQYRASLGLLVVAVGSFVLRSFVGTFFNF